MRCELRGERTPDPLALMSPGGGVRDDRPRAAIRGGLLTALARRVAEQPIRIREAGKPPSVTNVSCVMPMNSACCSQRRPLARLLAEP